MKIANMIIKHLLEVDNIANTKILSLEYDYFNKYLYLEKNEWDYLKNIMKNKNRIIPPRFIYYDNGVFFPQFKRIKLFNYLKLFSDIYGGDWYYDDTVLLQGIEEYEIGIVLKDGITFKELIKEIENDFKIINRKKKIEQIKINIILARIKKQ